MILFGLFVSSFLAATILPFSSEVALVSAIAAGANRYEAFFVASFGNVLAVVFNYYLGYFLHVKTKKRLFSSKTGRKSYIWGKKYGVFALFLSPFPIVGDPVTIVAGLFRVNFLYFLVIAGGLRVFRYFLIIYIY